MMPDEVQDLYQEAILDRVRAPHRRGRPGTFDVAARADNPMCGDRIDVWLSFDSAGRIARAAFEARGCSLCLASADLMAEEVEGRTPQAARALAEQIGHMARGESHEECAAGLKPLAAVTAFPSRIMCVTLPWKALTEALASEKERP